MFESIKAKLAVAQVAVSDVLTEAYDACKDAGGENYQKGKEKEAAMWDSAAVGLHAAAVKCEKRADVCRTQAGTLTEAEEIEVQAMINQYNA